MFTMNKRRAIFLVLILCIGTYASYKGYRGFYKHQKRAKGFSIEKVTNTLEYNPAWDVSSTEDEKITFHEILKQPFFFVGKGKQCFAFVSCDGKYVLKFPKHTDKGYLTNLPDVFLTKKFKSTKLKKKAKKLDSVIQSFVLAKQVLPKETGVVFLHLNNTENQFGTVRLLDERGALFIVPLDTTQFIVQKRADFLKPMFVTLMFEGKVEEAKKRIDQIFELVVRCAQLNIQDSDGALIRNNNLGFVDDSAVYIDTGKLLPVKKTITRESFTHGLRHLKPLGKWFANYYPELAPHFEQAQEKAIKQFPKEKL
jgi:hypothetical protein